MIDLIPEDLAYVFSSWMTRHIIPAIFSSKQELARITIPWLRTLFNLVAITTHYLRNQLNPWENAFTEHNSLSVLSTNWFVYRMPVKLICWINSANFSSGRRRLFFAFYEDPILLHLHFPGRQVFYGSLDVSTLLSFWIGGFSSSLGIVKRSPSPCFGRSESS